MKQFTIGGLQWPHEIPDRVFVGDPESSVAVCILWQPLAKFCDSLHPDTLSKINIAGQLKDPSGLGYMVRNILGNPRIIHLIICGHDSVLENNAVSEDRVSTRDLLVYLFDKSNTKSVCADYLDENLPEESIVALLNNVQIIDLYKATSEQVSQKVNDYACKCSKFWMLPKIYPHPKVSLKNSVPTLSLNTIIADTIVDGYVLLLKRLETYGIFQDRCKYPEGTLTGFSAKVVIKNEDPDNLFFKQNYLPPGCNKEYLERQYFPQVLRRVVSDGEEYSYGSLLGDQIDYIVKALLEDKNSKDAVASLWNPEIHQNHNDPPCLVFIQALILGDKLYLVCNMRSHNIIKCWPENAFAFCKLQGLIFNQLKSRYKTLQIGDLAVHSMSAQFNLNTRQLKIAKSILEAGYKAIRKKYFAKDAVNCLVSVSEEQIVLQVRSKGKMLREYKARSAKGMKNKIHLDGLDFISDHAMYIGITLAEAEMALRMGVPFEQDKKLPLGVGLEIDKSNSPFIAVDFDGVIHKYGSGWRDGSVYDVVMDGTVESLEYLKGLGFRIVIYSTRGNVVSQRKEMEKYLNENNIPYDIIIVGGKPYARYYIDDKAIRFTDWKQAIVDLKKCEIRRL